MPRISSLTLSLVLGILDNRVPVLCKAEGGLMGPAVFPASHKTPFSRNEDQHINTRSNQHDILVEWLWQGDDTTLSSHPISVCRRGCLARAKQWQHLPSASAPSPPPSLPVPLPLLGQFICSKIESKNPHPSLNNSLLLLGSDKTLIKAVVAPLKPAGACCRFGP